MASYELFSVKNYENASNNFIKNSTIYYQDIDKLCKELKKDNIEKLCKIENIKKRHI